MTKNIDQNDLCATTTTKDENFLHFTASNFFVFSIRHASQQNGNSNSISRRTRTTCIPLDAFVCVVKGNEIRFEMRNGTSWATQTQWEYSIWSLYTICHTRAGYFKQSIRSWQTDWMIHNIQNRNKITKRERKMFSEDFLRNKRPNGTYCLWMSMVERYIVTPNGRNKFLACIMHQCVQWNRLCTLLVNAP